MDRFNVVENTVRVRATGLVEWLFGCAHGRTTFPMTLPASGTYIVCLECGRHFAYDWTTMRTTGQRVARPGLPMLLPGLSKAARGSR
jgi:hypothetical protein